VIPGLIESHSHPDLEANFRTQWVLFSYPQFRSKAEVLAYVASNASNPGRDGYIKGFGYDDVKFGGYLTIDELDAAAPNTPVFILRTDSHVGLANTLAIKQAGFYEKGSDDGLKFGSVDRDSSGRPTGLLREAASDRIWFPLQDRITYEDLKRGLAMVFEEYARRGITSVYNSLTTELAYRAYQDMSRAGELGIRVGVILSGRDGDFIDRIIASGTANYFGDDSVRIIGVEWCPDCSTSGRTAAYHEPYVGKPINGEPVPNYGMLLHDADEFERYVKKAHRAGFVVCADGVGDRGIDFVLDGYEKALKELPKEDHRFRVEHCCYVTPKILERLKRLNVIASSATGFAYDLGDAYVRNRGEDAMKYMWPHRTMNDNGIVAPGHSDAPVCQVNPFRGMYSMVARKTDSGQSINASEAISNIEALNCYTYLGAYSGREENSKGTIEAGKLADFVVIDRDLTTATPDEIRDTQVLATYLGGRRIYKADSWDVADHE
jgi:predicted amidohydrolase YtcJ